MSRTLRAVAGMLTALMLLVVASCADSGASGSEPVFEDDDGATPQVSVDTPELRKLRDRAGIEACPSTDRATEPVEDGLPATVLPCLGGGEDVLLPGLRGKPMVVNLWASWCKPCRDELPHFQRLHEQTGDRLRMLGVDFQDASPEGALRLAADTGVTYPLLADPEATVRKDLGVVGLPQTVFVDESGRIVAVERREITSYSQLADLVRKHLKVAP